MVTTVIVQKISAQEIGISIKPIMTKIDIKPNSKVDIEYEIINSADPTNIKVDVLPSEPYDYYGNLQLSNKKNKDIAITAVSKYSENENFFLEKNTSKKFRISISISEGTTEGDYFYSIIASTNPQPAKQGTAVSRIALGLASTIILSVREKIVNDSTIAIKSFSIIDRAQLFGLPFKTIIVDSSSEFRAQLLVTNTGNHTVSGNGTVIISDDKDGFNSYPILPEYIAPGWYRVSRVIKHGSPSTKKGETISVKPLNVGFGKITASLISPNGSRSEATISFFAVPFLYIKLLLPISASLLIFIFVGLRNKG